MGPGIVILIWVGIAPVGVSIFIFAMIADKKRKEALQKLAVDLGLEYRDSLTGKDSEDFAKFSLANKGHNRQTANVIVADSGELRMLLFDYRFTTGSGKNKSTHRQTVVLTGSPTLQLPEFSLGPESFLHRLGDLFGVKDIDFEDDPEFSRRFLLRGPNETAIRDFFGLERRKGFLAFHGVSIEGQGSRFIFYQARQRWDTDKIKVLMEQAFSIYKLLS